MVDIWVLFTQMLLLVIMLIPGVVMRKFRLGDEGFATGISNLILYVAQLALLISAFIRPFDGKLLGGMLGVLVFSLLAHILSYGVALLTVRGDKSKLNRVLRFAVVFSNAGYMGIPLIEAVLGSEVVIYATVYNVSFNLFMWSLGHYIITDDRKYVSPKKMFINPVTIAIYLGLIIFVLPIDGYIPSVIISAIDTLKALVAPLSMLLVGYHMAAADFSTLFKNIKLWIAIAARLFICPALLFAVMKLCSLLGIYHNETVATIVLLAGSTPAATATSMLAQKFSGDTKTAGMIVPVSTVLSVVSMPVVALLLNLY